MTCFKVSLPYFFVLYVEMANRLLYKMNAKDVFPLVLSFNTTDLPAIDDKAAVAGARGIAGFFNDIKSEAEG